MEASGNGIGRSVIESLLIWACLRERLPARGKGGLNIGTERILNRAGCTALMKLSFLFEKK
jgi:hypothetical protein